MTLTDPSVHQAVLQVQNIFWTALKTKDASSFESILSDSFLSRSPDQANQSRAEFIKTLVSFPMTVVSVEASNFEVHQFNDVAILTGTQIAHLQLPDRTTIINRIAVTNVFHHLADRWLMVLTHTVDLSP
jgi:hypothetical protein